MHTSIMSASLQGIEAVNIEVEVDVSSGLPGMTIVGLADHAIRESRDRIRAAIKNAGYKFPNRRITINLAPAHLKKEGTTLDLPIATGILATSADQPDLASWLQNYLFIGELSLDGSVKPVRGCLSIALMAKKHGYRGIILPRKNTTEAAAIDNIEIIGIENIQEVMQLITGKLVIQPCEHQSIQPRIKAVDNIDFAEVRGQQHAKRALEIAAAGGHNLIFIGPPGSGKSMLAKRLRTILPPLSFEEAIETTIIHMAHHGVLFLDELPEFRKNVIEMLRQPLEDQRIIIARAKGSASFPATFILIAATAGSH